MRLLHSRVSSVAFACFRYYIQVFQVLHFVFQELHLRVSGYYIHVFQVLDSRISGITFTIVTKCLREGEDSIVQHYAAKTIENVATTDTQYREKFAVAETAQVLAHVISDKRD